MKKTVFGIPLRDLIFICAVVMLVIFLVLSDTSVDIRVNYDEDFLYVTSPRLNIDIANHDVACLSLVSVPDLGQLVDGYQHESYCTGVWKNELWGEYQFCILPALPQCVVVELVSGEFIVFNCTTEAKTTQLFESYRNYIRK